MLTRKRYSLLGNLTVFVCAVMLIISTYFLYRLHNIQSQLIVKQFSIQAESVEKYFIERILYTGSILGYIGRQIQYTTPEGKMPDLHAIDHLFQVFSKDPNIQQMLSSSIIGWVNTDYQQVVDGKYRIMGKPIDLSKRDYLPETVKEPWAIKLGQPVLGATSSEWIIPAGVGVADKKGSWLGALVLGFQQRFLQESFKEILGDERVNIALMDLTGQILVEAPTHYISQNISLKDKIRNIPLPSERSRSSLAQLKPFHHIGWFGWGTSYYYYKIPHYEYVIMLTRTDPVTWQEVRGLFIAHLPELGIMLLLVVLGTGFLKRRIIAPIVALSGSAFAISEGKTDTVIPPMNTIEAERLAKALESVKTLVKNEQGFKQELEIAHHQVQHANSLLEQKIKELEEALSAKNEFLDNISHEMRTPVHGVRGYSEILLEDWQSMNEEAKLDIAREIFASSTRLANLVTNLLDLSKYRAGKMRISPREADIAAVTESVIHDCKPLYMSKPLTIVLEKHDVQTRMLFDKDRIAQVIRNLLANAIKFTDSGTITASISEATLTYADGTTLPAVQISLRDQGKGIPENELEEIFAPFTQSSRTKTGAGGTGLGLSISREIIALHHGAIWAENNPGGNGATLSFVLPRKV